MRRIEEFHLFCATNDLALLIDSEMILQQPVKLMEINQNLICLNLLRVSRNPISYRHRDFNLIYFFIDLYFFLEIGSASFLSNDLKI